MAVKRRKRNAKESKGKKALKTTGRALKKAASSVLGAGSQILGAGSKALANPKGRSYQQLVGDAIKVLGVGEVSSLMQGGTLHQIHRKYSQAYNSFRDKEAKAYQGLIVAWSLKPTLEARQQAGLANPKKRNKTIIKAKRIDHLDVSKVHNPKKRIKKVKRNVAGAKRRSKKSSASGSVLANKTRSKASAKRSVSRVVVARKRATKAKRVNPTAEQIRKEFAGRIDGEKDLFFPQGTPTGKLAKLGKLQLIEAEHGKFVPVKGIAWLCSDTNGKLHIGTPNKGYELFTGAARNYGRVKRIEYQEAKPHLGDKYRNQIIWFHHMGEGGGQRPTFRTDGKGGARFIGGTYQIRREGIVG